MFEINTHIIYKKVWNKKGHKEEACGLVLYTNNGGSRIKERNQIKCFILMLGSMLNKSKNNPKIEDKKELVLHA